MQITNVSGNDDRGMSRKEVEKQKRMGVDLRETSVENTDYILKDEWEFVRR